MPDTTQPADPVAAELGYLRACIDAAQVQPEAFDPGVLLAKFGCAVAALEAGLAEHRKITVHALSVLAYDNQEPPRVWCGHTYAETENDRHLMADDDAIVCLDKPEGDVCADCYEEGGERVEWPCPTYRAISAALLGSETVPAGEKAGDG